MILKIYDGDGMEHLIDATKAITSYYITLCGEAIHFRDIDIHTDKSGAICYECVQEELKKGVDG